MRKSKKRLTLVFAALTLSLCMLAVTTAYFTDREQATATATAGTLDLTLKESWTDATGFKPGDKYDLSYTLTNGGNKSADVRETIVITSSAAMDTKSTAEFELYALTDLEQQTDGTWAPTGSATPIPVRSISGDGLKVTYKIPEFVLNGTGTAAEAEESIASNEKAGSYAILFKASAGNTFQGAKLSIDYLAEAKQHRNTDSNIWTTVANEQISFAGSDTSVVPAA